MSKRAHISLETKLAAALLARGEIPYEHAKLMTADQIISLYHFDHNILHGIEINDQFWNLAPMLLMAHREKSKKDTAIVAKVARIRGETGNGPKQKIAARANAWPAKGTRKIQTRGFPKRGEVVTASRDR